MAAVSRFPKVAAGSVPADGIENAARSPFFRVAWKSREDGQYESAAVPEIRMYKHGQRGSIPDPRHDRHGLVNALLRLEFVVGGFGRLLSFLRDGLFVFFPEQLGLQKSLCNTEELLLVSGILAGFLRKALVQRQAGLGIAVAAFFEPGFDRFACHALAVESRFLFHRGGRERQDRGQFELAVITADVGIHNEEAAFLRIGRIEGKHEILFARLRKQLPFELVDRPEVRGADDIFDLQRIEFVLVAFFADFDGEHDGRRIAHAPGIGNDAGPVHDAGLPGIDQPGIHGTEFLVELVALRRTLAQRIGKVIFPGPGIAFLIAEFQHQGRDTEAERIFAQLRFRAQVGGPYPGQELAGQVVLGRDVRKIEDPGF